MTKEYAVYRGDDLIVSGSLLRVSLFLGIKTETVIWMATPSARARRKGSKRAMIVYRFEEENCE